MKIAVVTDTGSNITYERRMVEGVYVLPLVVVDKDKSYLEGVDIDIDQTNQLISEGRILKTSMTPLGKVYETFDRIKKDGYDAIFCVPINPGFSSLSSILPQVAADVGLGYDWIDCYAVAAIELHLALSARTLLDQGRNIEDIKKRLRKSIENSNTYVVPDNFDHLSKSGRVTPIVAAMVGLLKLYPVVWVNEATAGKVDRMEICRTRKKAYRVIMDSFRKSGVGEGYLICVAHTRCQEMAMEFHDLLQENFPQAEIYLVPLVSVVGLYTGLNTVACQFIKKVDLS